MHRPRSTAVGSRADGSGFGASTIEGLRPPTAIKAQAPCDRIGTREAAPQALASAPKRLHRPPSASENPLLPELLTCPLQRASDLGDPLLLPSRIVGGCWLITKMLGYHFSGQQSICASIRMVLVSICACYPSLGVRYAKLLLLGSHGRRQWQVVSAKVSESKSRALGRLARLERLIVLFQRDMA